MSGLANGIGNGTPFPQKQNTANPGLCFIITELDEFCEQEVGQFRMVPETCP
jgi:hypothetical protein